MLENKPNMPEKLESMMKKQGYHFVGKHSAVKLCGYTTSSLKNGTACYKNQFYGIRSWRCVQSAPTLGCDLACSFCWRIIPEGVGLKWNELNLMMWDEPAKIADGFIETQKKMLVGYKGNEKVNKKRLEEANDPAHVTFSLTGEPLFYPKMSELIEEFHKRKVSTFLVTNGTLPEALRRLKALPTQLYVSIQAPNKEIYEKVARPKIPHTWENFLEFLEIFSKLNTRRVFRLTLIRGLNLVDAKGYAELIKRGDPDYVEVKGFVFVGGARNPSRGLGYGLMPSKEEIIDFAKEIDEYSGYIFTDYHRPSNVALLSRNEEVASKRMIKFEK